MDLKQAYKILSWHNTSRDKPPGESVGLFIPLPENLSKQFPPDGKAQEDTSPCHVTLYYIGELENSKQQDMIGVVRSVAKITKPFQVSLAPSNFFVNKKNQKIIHSPVIGEDLQKLHYVVQGAFKFLELPFLDKYPEYKPHVTIEYVNEGEQEKYGNLSPRGEWLVDHFWIWGTEKPEVIRLEG